MALELIISKPQIKKIIKSAQELGAAAVEFDGQKVRVELKGADAVDEPEEWGLDDDEDE